ncbi:hypothetical protein QBC41DRAFT_325207 [Cercophora samala]|uniref:DUF7770 domain-containing protein n=1 Tax=Cercophora samala TaxID=330535 RepID=A0AA40DAH2_9PEZI|nr:hypothetical protein QBC41DRAFT_325207 [Cercophora samala]
MDSNWDADKLKAEDLSARVSIVFLVAYENPSNKGDEEGLPPTNHWCLFLKTAGTASASIRVDMTPGYGSDGLRGKIEISSKPYECTNSSIKTLSFPATLGVTVQKIIDLISSKGRQKYQFTPEWEGCRYWNKTVVQDLQSAGYIKGGAKEAEEALGYYWVTPSGKQKRAIGKGTFRA